MSEQKEPIVGHLVVKGDHNEFLVSTTTAIRKYTAEGYEVETNYQTSLDPKTGEHIHSAYLVGKLKEPKPVIDSFELGRLEEWVENEYTMGDMPNGAYNTIREMIEQNKLN
ncbi:hypothetical protein Blue_038 [Bacillus phage Deep Blue]|uniref:Uncharacterized protein n=1 Tax=Bacillus phage Deep Blue TaxID=1792245 RepID=A0A140HLJ9_9CAUD|nr:radical SAM domain-containing protein [Bacillus phage Deep Blue]AMO25861.1 hypothetical protein Blue_038 [Bacillus phage Deep Blue]